MTDPLARLAASEDSSERVRAAQLIARSDAADKEAIVLRLLRDPDTTVSEAMVAAVLEVRREGAIRLILRALGQPDGAAPDGNDECLLEGLLNGELDGVDVRGSIVSALLETHARDELLGALAAIAWLAPSGGFSAPPSARALVRELAADSNEAIRSAAREALAALGAPWQQPDV
jgi:HEAT repeat protein